MSDRVTIRLPYPPSVNHLFAGKTRRFASVAYKRWQAKADAALLEQRPLPRFTDRVVLTMTFGRPDRRTRDIGNLEKAVSDRLVHNGVLADDSLIERLTLAWGVEPGCKVEIELFDGLPARVAAAGEVA